MLKSSGHQVSLHGRFSNMASVRFIHSQTIKIGRGPSDCVMKYRREFKKAKTSARFSFPSMLCSFFKELIIELFKPNIC